MKQEFERTPNGFKVIVDHNLRAKEYLGIPATNDVPDAETLNDNDPALPALIFYNGALYLWNGTAWVRVGTPFNGGTVSSTIFMNNGTNTTPSFDFDPHNGDRAQIFATGTTELNSLLHFRWLNDLDEPQGFVFENFDSNTNKSKEILRFDQGQFKFMGNDVFTSISKLLNLDVSQATPITSNDTIIAALGKLQAQISNAQPAYNNYTW